MFFLLFVILVIFVFEYINGFHDAANAIATVVSTRVLAPRQAVLLGAVFNFIGALSGEAVAKTVGAGLVDTSYVTMTTLLCAMLAGICWNLFTWWNGLPTSSSHALIGGLCGAALGSANGNWSVIRWSVPAAGSQAHSLFGGDGLFPKVIVPMITSPIAGLLLGYFVMQLLFVIVHTWRPRTVSLVFGKLQLLSAGYMGWGHGFADAQKTMGILALATFTATKAGRLEHLPWWLHFLYAPKFAISLWIKIACASVMAAGTWGGGWRIIRTLGHRLVSLKPIHGFAAEASGATILLVAGRLGMPVSTTHAITTSVMGVGLAKRAGSLDRMLVGQILWAWVFTIPVTGFLAFVLTRLFAAAHQF